ncbi:hypothetical protein MJA45_10775 [Paenibacillus aurantius]|uniref:DUF2157 domain-containing protein n=1 Tax=Paenibacillus aurantius TaxID=2918900 RepID=A0AA96LHP0_9BACL|nr:hypothetical protein [Paenibacillus aurantius]WNQ13474.1 hypothetical protein MJA45_10775 [Paenibacillus aurantius]
MNPDKKQTIVEEIERWRRSRLLPEQYCDFLLNLYREEDSGQPRSMREAAQAGIRQSRGRHWLLIFGSIGLFCLIGFHFNSFPPALQMAVLAVLVLILYTAGFRYRDRKPLLSSLLLGGGAVSLLAGGVYFLQKAHAPDWAVIAFLAACSFLWMLTGLLAGRGLFHFCGWVGLALLYGWFLEKSFPDLDMAGLEMSWLPVCLVLAWLGWLFHFRSKEIGSVLLLVGFLLWFMPEAHGLAATEVPKDWLQLAFFAKLVLAGIGLFALRKKWTEWVA